MLRRQRLRGRRQLAAVFGRGKTWSSSLLVLRALSNNLPHNRYVFVAGRRLGRAVVRNRLKRRLREIIRSLPLQQGWDIAIIGRAEAVKVSFEELKQALADLLVRAGIVKQHKIL